jgi:putative PIN family toxin of toxin-antitoxin system
MPDKRKIVLDTNCLIASLSRRGQYYSVWKGLQAGKYILCVSTEILEEYAEIITQKASVGVAANVIHLLLESEYVELVTPYFSLHLIEEDHDDDKFVDCAFAANATFIVSEDKHYNVLQDIDFPKLLVLKLKEFLDLLQSEDKDNVEL